MNKGLGDVDAYFCGFELPMDDLLVGHRLTLDEDGGRVYGRVLFKDAIPRMDGVYGDKRALLSALKDSYVSAKSSFSFLRENLFGVDSDFYRSMKLEVSLRQQAHALMQEHLFAGGRTRL